MRLAFVERCWCWATVVLKALLLARRWGRSEGFDAGDLLHRVEAARWFGPEPALDWSYWAYHPPLGFLLPRVGMALGLSAVAASQLVCTLAAVGAFLAFRAAMLRAGALRSAAGVCALYLSASVPMGVAAGAVLNLDVFVLAAAAVVAWASVAACAGDAAQRWPAWIGWGAVAAAALCAGCMTKFSGWLAFAIPACCAFLAPGGWRARLRRIAWACCVAAAALALLVPYWRERYRRATGEWFPGNNRGWYPAPFAAAAVARDADPAAFLGALVAPSFLQPPRPAGARDLGTVRLSDAWGDFWLRDRALGEPAGWAIPAGVCLAWGMPALLAAGGVAWVRAGWRRRGAWVGAVACAFGAIQAAALGAYCWKEPLAEVAPAKGLYILPCIWALGWLAAGLARARPFRGWRRAVLASVALWWFLAHAVPVY